MLRVVIGLLYVYTIFCKCSREILHSQNGFTVLQCNIQCLIRDCALSLIIFALKLPTYLSLLAAVSLLPYFTKLKGVRSYVCNEFLRC